MKFFLGFVFFLSLFIVTNTAQADDNFFTPFQTSDWIGFGLTAAADFADMDSSYSEVVHEQSALGQPMACPSGVNFQECFHTFNSGEGNPLIREMFGTKYPTALDYAAFGFLELGIQTVIAWALPESWRNGAWGLFVGIGVADTVINSYGGGVTFRF